MLKQRRQRVTDAVAGCGGNDIDGPWMLKQLKPPRRQRAAIEEYARHNGHADLLRERIDGTAGL
jgi:Protein of unknown function (DUF664)